MIAAQAAQLAVGFVALVGGPEGGEEMDEVVGAEVAFRPLEVNEVGGAGMAFARAEILREIAVAVGQGEVALPPGGLAGEDALVEGAQIGGEPMTFGGDE